jgi:WD40 repeat protein
MLATASLDGTVKLWDVASGTNTATLAGHTAGVTGVAFSRDATMVISCSLDKTVRFWNATTGEQLAAFAGEKKLYCLALSPDGGTLAVGSGWWSEAASPNVVSFWDPVLRQRLTNDVSVHAMVQTLSFSPNGKTLAVGMADDSLELVDVASKRSFFLSTNLTSEVAWSAADETLAVGDETDWIGLFDTATRRISRRIQMPSAATRYGACSPDGKTMAIFYTTTRIKLCNVATGREVATLQGHEGFGMYLAFSHDGQTLASVGNDRTIRLWRAPRK